MTLALQGGLLFKKTTIHGLPSFLVPDDTNLKIHQLLVKMYKSVIGLTLVK